MAGNGFHSIVPKGVKVVLGRNNKIISTSLNKARDETLLTSVTAMLTELKDSRGKIVVADMMNDHAQIESWNDDIITVSLR